MLEGTMSLEGKGRSSSSPLRQAFCFCTEDSSCRSSRSCYARRRALFSAFAAAKAERIYCASSLGTDNGIGGKEEVEVLIFTDFADISALFKPG